MLEYSAEEFMTPQELNSVREKISKAYLYALIAKLNYGIDECGKDLDGCGYDFRVVNHSLGQKRTAASEMCEIKIQLKGVSSDSTSMIQENDACIKYRLSSDLPKWGSSCYLVVVTVPKKDDFEEWIILSEEQIVLKKCAFFLEVPSDGLRSGFVEIPKSNLLTVESFRSLFSLISKDKY